MIAFVRIGVAILLGVSTAWAWQTKLPVVSGDPPATAITTPLGDVVVARCVTTITPGRTRLVVSMLRGRTGVQLWQRAIPGIGYCVAKNLIADDAGDVILAVWLTGFEPTHQAVVKLAGSDGHELWRREVEASVPRGFAQRPDGSIVVSDDAGIVALDAETGAELWSAAADGALRFLASDATGDLFAVLVLPRIEFGPPGNLIVVKLDGASGGEIWRREFDGTGTGGGGSDISYDGGTGLAVDEAGDVVVAGWLTNASDRPNYAQQDAFVAKLAGASGDEQWRAVLAGPSGGDDSAYSLRIAPGGDPVVGLHFDQRARVMRLSGASGAVAWQALWGPGQPDVEEYVQSVALDASGDVLVMGRLDERVAVSRFSGATGVEQWMQTFVKARKGDDPFGRDVFVLADALAVGPRGEVMVSGTSGRYGSNFTASAAVATVFASTVAGQRLVIRDLGTLRRVALVMRDPHITPALPGGAGDPSISGASLALSSASGDHALLALPASGWSRGDDGGFEYHGAPGSQTCPEVVLAPGSLTARCRTDDAGLLLDAPLGSVEVAFRIGEPGFPYCASFGGTVQQDRPVSGDLPGLFRAIDAPPPESCE